MLVKKIQAVTRMGLDKSNILQAGQNLKLITISLTQE
jgi:hypothetical protein